jgi:hypothetical protein
MIARFSTYLDAHPMVCVALLFAGLLIVGAIEVPA